ncbi:unnamed protein product [Prunus armeniaca]
MSKRGRQTEAPRAIFAAEDDDGHAKPITIACSSKTVQFANHMILSSQMELLEIEELPKRLIREEAGRAFRLQASDKQAAERQVKASEAKLAEMRAALDAAMTAVKDVVEVKEAVQTALEESERAKTAEIDAAVREAIRGYRSSEEFTVLLDN